MADSDGGGGCDDDGDERGYNYNDRVGRCDSD